jgi:hypothetical protein
MAPDAAVYITSFMQHYLQTFRPSSQASFYYNIHLAKHIPLFDMFFDVFTRDYKTHGVD